jgi:mannose-6-phosphate isomerase-like protein (cupin superfamily)
MSVLSARLAELIARLPGKASPGWPDGEPFTLALAHGTMSVEIYAPRGTDPQTPHAQDELYIVQAGRAVLLLDGARHAADAGTVLFVPAGAEHRFLELSAEFVAWVVFWGPAGGERGP